MRRIPTYFVTTITGLLLSVMGIATILAFNSQVTPAQLVPTAIAMLTQMPPQKVATQLAQMGYVAPPSALATAQAMFSKNIPADQIISTLVASYSQPAAPGGGATAVPASPVAPTNMPASPTANSQTGDIFQKATQQAAATQVIPLPTASDSGNQVVPLPTASDSGNQVIPFPTASDNNNIFATTEADVEADNADNDIETSPVTMGDQSQDPAMPTATLEAPSSPTPVAVADITGSISLQDSDSSQGITLTLTRPDGSTLDIPVGADGKFSFAGMDPGDYTLEASAQGYLSERAQFTLQAGQNFALSPALMPVGDTNGDDVIDLLDAALIASNFSDKAEVPQADLNHDGKIDVGDLTMIGSQFGLAGPLTWNTPNN